ncbi:flagellar hook-associated protein FlgK [Desulfitobacterium sp. Sab5]|uniref:flagellar hook-associated protein FlgK n=1 Tax=Desulfitobacterium nosdiversum TaxID=3375356 RepID=UPI003CEC82BD
MNSTFFGLELSRRALEAQQTALDITGHNIANSNTQGYTRQIANLKSTAPDTIFGMGHNLSLGTGVVLDNITRARDNFVDTQYRWENSKQGYWLAREDSLNKIESLYNEPTSNSLHDDMDKFWTAWSDLAKDPENVGAKSVVVERALTLTDSFHNITQQIITMKKDITSNIKLEVQQINTVAEQIKNLNDQIKRAEVAGDNPNDLRDKRDLLVDDLSKLVNVKVVETRDTNFTDRQVNNYKIVIGNDTTVPEQVLVNDSQYYKLKIPDPTVLENPISTDPTTYQISFENGTLLKFGDKQGQLQANMSIAVAGETTDGSYTKSYLDTLQSQFDSLAQGIAAGVNYYHNTKAGYTPGVDFFATSDSTATITAANIVVNSTLQSSPKDVVTGISGEDIGKANVAKGIAAFASGFDQYKTDSGSASNPVDGESFGDYYGANVVTIGVDVQQAQRMREGQDVLVTHMSNQRESYSGVSLDEEMTNLVKFQKSYAAAARMVTMMDDMLNTIVNGMGITR